MVFGGLATAPWEIRPSYYGESDSIVFSGFPASNFRVFGTTGKNNFYQLANEDSVAMGGGGDFALFLDDDLTSGTSGPCKTFNSPCLASAEDFDCKHVEVWGFVTREGGASES